MLNNYIALLPELILFLGLICMSLIKLVRKNNTPKTFYTISRLFLFFGAIMTAIFYNQNVDDYLYVYFYMGIPILKEIHQQKYAKLCIL